jgi:ring-1,2-phenylacetyl-CoA epoxidase subunit PaaD
MVMGAAVTVPASGPSPKESRVWDVLSRVEDPEIPVLTLLDLGVIRYVQVDEAGGVTVGLSPTYSGCPATTMIRASIVDALRAARFSAIQVVEVLSPPWSSDWLSVDGREKLRRYGIAPPADTVNSPRHLLGAAPSVHCPQCGSLKTTAVSGFGSTPCKALYR